MWMSGGATHSPLWPALLANVTGIPLHVARGGDWPAGAAILAGVGCGLLGERAAATVQWQLPLAQLEPDPGAGEVYAGRYMAYRKMSDVLAADSG